MIFGYDENTLYKKNQRSSEERFAIRSTRKNRGCSKIQIEASYDLQFVIFGARKNIFVCSKGAGVNEKNYDFQWNKSITFQ